MVETAGLAGVESGEWCLGVRLIFQIVNDARGEGSVEIEKERRTDGSFLKVVILP